MTNDKTLIKSPSGPSAGGVDDENHDGDDDNSQAAEGEELLVGVLLILIGLVQILFAVSEVIIGFLHFF